MCETCGSDRFTTIMTHDDKCMYLLHFIQFPYSLAIYKCYEEDQLNSRVLFPNPFNYKTLLLWLFVYAVYVMLHIIIKLLLKVVFHTPANFTFDQYIYKWDKQG